jgi:hypothetical protein
MDWSGVDDSGADSANDIIYFSSRGPCLDGRRKPDIASPGTHVSGGVAQAPNPSATGTADPCFDGSGVSGGLFPDLFWPSGQEFYTACSGTSQATPGAAGSAALVRQWFINNYGAPPSAAMTKAYLMNSARYMTGVGANDNLPSNSQGMGEINLGMAFDNADRMLRDQLTNDMFTATGQSRSYTYAASDLTKPVRITLAWTDAPGNTSGAAYNNNLDLLVTVGGVAYHGNVFKGAYSAAGGAADFRNNVESVFLPAGISGTMVITVTAANLNSDGVPNNGIPLDQDFALVMYNCTFAPPVINSITPTNQTILVGQNASFTVDVTGRPPLFYYLLKNGAFSSPSPSLTNVLTINNAQVADSGAYSVLVSNRYGTDISSPVTLTVVPTVPLGFALDNTNTQWTTDPILPWYGQTSVSHDNTASGRSYFIKDGQQTLMTARTNGPATLKFWWKVSSETNHDIASFQYTSGQMTNTVTASGEVDWNETTVFLPVGPVNLSWDYAKDTNGISSGQDAIFVDQVRFIPGGTSPFITRNPAGGTAAAATPVTLSVGAGGTPLLGYQWQLNGVDIAGATASSLTIPSPGRADAGNYSARVVNAYGSTNSSAAYLGIVPLVMKGDNSLGQTTISMVATNAIMVAAGTYHTVVLRGDGTVLAWGDNYDHQCDAPQGLVNVVQIAAGGYHSLALQANGTVVGWGANTDAQAAPPAGLKDVIAIAAGTWHSLALKADGTVVAWGDNTFGQCTIPAGLKKVIAIAAGGNHNLALLSNHTVVAWGENTDELGDFSGQSLVPWGLSGVKAIGAGEYHSLAVKNDGTVVAWGDNSEGQCQPPDGLNNVVAVAGGGAHSLALKADATVIGWGNNWSGEASFATNVSNVAAMAAGNAHSVLLVGIVAPTLYSPNIGAARFATLVSTFPGKSYELQFKSNLAATGWTPVSVVIGNGAPALLTDPSPADPRRFYRVVVY